MAAMAFAFIAGSVISAGASIYAGEKAAGAARDASAAANVIEREKMAQAWEMYQQNREDLAPWMEAGKRGLDQYESLLEDPSQIVKSPGYEFRLGEALKAVQNRSGVAGSVYGGSALKEMQKYASDYASGEFGSRLAQLAALSEIGRGTTGRIGQIGENVIGQEIASGARMGGNIINAGNVRASAYGAQAAGVNQAVQGGFSNYMLYDYLKKKPPTVLTA